MVLPGFNLVLRLALIAAWFASVSAGLAQERLQIFTTTTDLRSLTEAVGGELVAAVSLVPPNMDAEDYQPKPQDVLRLKNARILVLGLAYKPDVDDVRESPSFELIEHLEQLGADVDYHDPHVPATHKMRHHDLQMRSIELTPEALAGYDCVVVATNHTAYDWQMVLDHAKLLVDTRGVTRNLSGPKTNVVQA